MSLFAPIVSKELIKPSPLAHANLTFSLTP